MSAQLGQNTLVAAKQSQLAPVLIGQHSFFKPRGWEACQVFHMDENVPVQALDGVPSFGSQVRFRINKNKTLVAKPLLETVLAPAVLNGGRSAAYVKNLGDQILAQVQARYGTNVLQSYPGEFQYIWRRLSRNDVLIEGVNAQVLGGLPVGGASETSRQTALTAGLTLFSPLEELYWWWNKDEYWMPEAHAQELELIITLAPLSQVVYSDNGTNPFATAPAITSCRLISREVTLSAMEKRDRLARYETPDGVVVKFLDLERQENFRLAGTGAGGTAVYTIPLNNIRLDMAEMMFLVREDSMVAGQPGARNPWASDALESGSTNSTVTGASIQTVVGITSFRLLSNGQEVHRSITDLFNRTEVRPNYHPEAQIGDFFYTLPFALYPEDRKNVTGLLPASNLGNLELEITMPGFAAASPKRVDIYVHSHNVIQHRDGNAVRVLN